MALTLRLLGGLTTGEIARGFLVPEPTVAQRIVQAKRTLTTGRVRFEPPAPAELAGRLSSVLEVIDLAFHEGCSANAGDDWIRPALCEEALRLGRILAGLMPHGPEVHGLVALMEVQASRIRGRTGPSGEPVLLLDQSRGRWNRLLIRRGPEAFQHAEALGDAPGPCCLQAAIAACHTRALTPEDTDAERVLARYPLLPAVRRDLIEKLGRVDETRRKFGHAASLTRNERERVLFLDRAANGGRTTAKHTRSAAADSAGSRSCGT